MKRALDFKEEVYELLNRLMNSEYDSEVSLTVNMIEKFLGNIERFLRDVSEVLSEDISFLYSTLSTLFIELGQYRFELSGSHTDVWFNLRGRVVELLGELFRRDELRELREELLDYILPYFKEGIGSNYPFRVLTANNATEDLYTLRFKTRNERLLQFLERAYMNKYPRFGTGGIRGLWGKEINSRKVKYVVQAIIDYVVKAGITERTFIVGYDGRLYARRVANWVKGVLLANGYDVYFTKEDSPTPALNFYAIEVFKNKLAGIINCTSSHNPYEWHGVKFTLPSGKPAPTEVTNWIGARANQLQLVEWKVLRRGKGKVVLFSPKGKYCEWALSKVNRQKIKEFFEDKLIVIDEMYSSGRGYLPQILNSMGLRRGKNFITIHSERSPTFEGLYYANPEEPYINELKEVVKEEGAILGLAMDADADRFGVIDERGEYVHPNKVLLLLTHYFFKEKYSRESKKLKVIKTVTTARLIDELLTRDKRILDRVLTPSPQAIPIYIESPYYVVKVGDKDYFRGLPTYTVDVGIKNLIDAMEYDEFYRKTSKVEEREHEKMYKVWKEYRDNIAIAGEESGGLTMRGHLLDKDGIWADLMVMEMMAVLGRPLGELWRELVNEIGKECFFKRIDLEGPTKAKELIIKKYFEHYLEEVAGQKVLYLGGIEGYMVEAELEGSRGWSRLIVRASGTEPLIRVYVESESLETMNMLFDQVIKDFTEICKGLVAQCKNPWRLATLLSLTPPFPSLIGIVNDIDEDLRKGSLKYLKRLIDILDYRNRMKAITWLSIIESSFPIYELK